MKEIQNISKYFNATMLPLCHFTKRIDFREKFIFEANNLRENLTDNLYFARNIGYIGYIYEDKIFLVVF